MARAADLLAQLRDLGYSDTADWIESKTRCSDARRSMARRALGASSDPLAAARRGWDDWLNEPPIPGDLSGAIDKEYARRAEGLPAL